MYGSLPFDMLKESTTHESWQKYYVNFPANLEARAKGEEDGDVWTRIEFDLWNHSDEKPCVPVKHHPLLLKAFYNLYVCELTEAATFFP